MKENDPIVFLQSKDFKFIRELGQGGTGRTILMKDENIEETFVCKKYSPFYEDDKDLYFDYFKNEIKLLFLINHRNIVRVFNYYLYSEDVTGYILMEFIDGIPIDKYLKQNPDKLVFVFSQVITGFKYLEEKEILHRDIRPENILVTNEGIVKIIDFGFGKKIDFDNNAKSITLNWRYSIPTEFNEEKYDHKTDLYFIGKLFDDIINSIGNVRFQFRATLDKMTISDYENRINSFFDVYREIISRSSSDINFSAREKNVYRTFADAFLPIISTIESSSDYEDDMDMIIKHLEELYKNSMLEDTLQDNSKLSKVFIKGSYRIYRKQAFKVVDLNSFLKLLKSSTEDKRKVILNNLWQRLDNIERYDDLPF
jgi:serine/threonine-protein kinase